MSGDPALLVLSPVFHGYWRSIERAFTTLGYAVTTVAYDAHPGRLDRARAKVAHDLVERLGGPVAARRAEQTARAVQAVREVDPEVVLVVKGDTFDAELWDLLQGRRHALWLYDELRRTEHTPTSLAAAGPVASYSPDDVETLTTAGLRSVHVPLAHDPEVAFTPVPSDEVVFVGARYPGRESLLTDLAAAQVPVRAYGRDWSGHPLDRLRTWRLRQPALPHGRDLPRADAYGVMAGARATLNVHGDQDGFTMRTFEACGVGRRAAGRPGRRVAPLRARGRAGRLRIARGGGRAGPPGRDRPPLGRRPAHRRAGPHPRRAHLRAPRPRPGGPVDGLTHPRDLEAWHRWQDRSQPVGRRAQRMLGVLRDIARPDGHAGNAVLTRGGPQPRVLVCLESRSPTSVRALLEPVRHLDPADVAVISPHRGHATCCPRARGRSRPASRPTSSPSTPRAVRPCSRPATTCRSGRWRTGPPSPGRFLTVQHGLLTPHAPPLGAGTILLAWSGGRCRVLAVRS